MTALEEHREDRYQTAAELASDLGNMLQVIRPTPGAGELGAFLSELVGHERPVSATAVPTARPAVTPPPRPTPPSAAQPPKPKPAPHSPGAEHVRLETPPVFTVPRQSRVGLIAAIGVVIVAVVAGVFYVTKFRRAGPGAVAEATPAPETVEMAREVAQQEVAKQTQALRERLSNEILSPSPVPAGRRPAPPPLERAAGAAPTPGGPAVGAPAGVDVRPAIAPSTPAQEPSPALAAAPPTEVPPTPGPAATPTSAPAPAPEQPVVPQPVVREGDLVELGGDVIPPQPIYNPKPAYPPLAARQHVVGTVFLEVLVDENGSVQDVKVLRGVKPNLGLDAAAAGAVWSWRYKPATKGGVRVKVRFTQAILFRL